MRLLRIIALLAVLMFVLPGVSGAAAGTTDQIVRDAQDGQINGLFTPAQLQAALSSPLLKTYGGTNGVEAVRSALGANTEAAGTSGALPFTGAEMATFAIIGASLLLAGFVLRRQSPTDPSDPR
jgi:hypothetical protein